MVLSDATDHRTKDLIYFLKVIYSVRAIAYVRKVAKKELTEEQERVLEDAEYSRFERPKTRSQTRNETS